MVFIQQGLFTLIDGRAVLQYAQRAKLAEVRLTPSARLLAELRATGESFVELALRMSTMHKAYFRDLHTPNPQRLAELSAEAEESLRRQREIEAKDRISFETYLANYFSDLPGQAG
jgi:glutamate--cysteine ligase